MKFTKIFDFKSNITLKFKEIGGKYLVSSAKSTQYTEPAYFQCQPNLT